MILPQNSPVKRLFNSGEHRDIIPEERNLLGWVCSVLVLAPLIALISGAPLFSGLFHSHTLLTDRPPKGDTRDPTTQLAPDQVAKRHQRGTRQTFGEGRRIAGHNRTTNTRNPPRLRQNRHGPHLSAWKKWINGCTPPGPADDAKTRRT